MTRTLRHDRVVTAGAVAVIALMVAACGAGTTNSGTGGGTSQPTDTSAPGVTSTSILVGTTQPLTGPAAPGYSKISAAMSAYFAYANASGGVHGRKVELKVVDDGYNPATTASATRELVLQDKVFALVGALGTPTHTAVLDFVAANRVPDLFVASGSRNWNQAAKYPTTFGWQPDYVIEGKILGDHIKKSFPDKKVCGFGQNDDFGKDGMTGVEQGLDRPLDDKQTYTPTNTNVAPQLGALQKVGCEVVVAFTVPGFTALALGTAAKLNYKPQFVVSNVGSDLATLTGFLKDATTALTNGMVTDTYLPIPTDTANEWIQLFQRVNRDYNNDAPFDGNVLFGMANAYTFLQALHAAGPDLTRGSLLAAVEKGGFTGPGLVPFRLSANDHAGYAGAQVVVVKSGAATTVGPAYVTDGGTGPLVAYTTAQPSPPANGLPR